MKSFHRSWQGSFVVCSPQDEISSDAEIYPKKTPWVASGAAMSRAPAIACQLSTPARDFARQASIPVQALSTFFIVRVCAHHIFTLASL
mmetsp:Transcript_39450/g.92418  ORF Transcript_39450/g.92418 Transcript_39450/m.92418 type:complete len:89 (-) Transcript_39450:37-303(-)